MRFFIPIVFPFVFAVSAMASPCPYWSSWQKLVAPQPVRIHLDTIRDWHASAAVLKEPPGKSPSRKNHQLCRKTFYSPKGFQHHFYHSTFQCLADVKRFGTTALAVNATPRGENFHNDIRAAMGVGSVSAERVRQFLLRQVGLLINAPGSWHQAFPNYVKANEKYSEVIFNVSSSLGETAKRVTIGAGWLPQKMWRTSSNWAQYLLRLATLFEVGFRVLDNKSRVLMSGEVDTATTTAKITYHVTKEGMVLTDPQETKAVEIFSPNSLQPREFTTIIDVVVRYAGLQIFVGGITFHHSYQPSQASIRLVTEFKGADQVSITGNYRGLGSKGLNSTIKEFVETEIQKNLMLLTGANGGKPWQFALELHGGFVRLSSTLVTPVNGARLLRPDHQVTLGHVSPEASVSREFNQWSHDAITALLADHQLFERKKCLP